MREELDEIVNGNKLIERSFEYFWNCYDNYLTDDITKDESREYGLIDRSSVTPKLYGYSYCVTNTYGFDTIKVYIDIFRKNEEKRFAEYWIIYSINGEVVDDFFVTE